MNTPINSHSEDNEAILIDLIISGLSIFRWNTFPRVRNITTLDHLWFVAHISLLIVHLEAENGNIYNIPLLLKKILFSGFFTFYYSDINAEVKERIREKSEELYIELENNVEKNLLNISISSQMTEDIKHVWEKTKEDTVIAFAKIWASYYEVQQNAILYPSAYEKLLSDIKKRSCAEEFAPFLKYIRCSEENQNNEEKYLLVIHRLASSFRWNRSVRKYPISVLSHTFLIAFLTYIIASKESLWEDDQTDMILTALFHDIPEAITGDIITPTKKAILWLDHIIEEVEKDMIHEHILSYIEKYPFSAMYGGKMLSPWKEKYGNLVKKADRQSALHEARIEAPYSTEYAEIYLKLKKQLEE